jgi:hypothetical protein
MSKPTEQFDSMIATRINSKVKSTFIVKCGKLNKNHAEVMRNMILALNEGRLTITPTKEEKELL